MDELERIDAHATGIKDLVKILDKKEQNEPQDIERPGDDPKDQFRFSTRKNAKLLWVPFAETPFGKDWSGNALYRNGPGRDLMEGFVIHFAANSSSGDDYKDALNVARWMRSKSLATFVTARTGEIIQFCPLNKWDAHAGSSSWTELSGRKRRLTGVSQYFGGNENCNPGRLTDAGGGKVKAWHGQTYDKDRCIYVDKKRGNIQPGWWMPLSKAQLESNIKLILWLAHNDEFFNIDNVVGHDEVAPNRKNDPGGTLWIDDPDKPVTVREFVEHIKGLT